MKIPLKLISFAFWVCFNSFAQGRGCLRKDINLENTERLEKHSYSHGETVKMNCITGFVGMHKFVCNNGEWEKRLNENAQKKCGHPGDTSNGDFTLLEGNTEFVFGATVEYTCNKGYEMVSRINQRTCRSGGWDNAIPSCEVKKCPPIYTEEDMTASGNTEEGSYSDVIQFDCVSSDQKIDGNSEIYCTEDGQWSNPVPKCIEITCTTPDIPNSTVMPKTKYKKDASLQYDCNAGYKPRKGIPKCTKFGWSLEPECEEITCELKETEFGIQKIVPQGKTFFRVGETMQITCSERYRIFNSKETAKTFTCQPDGQWDSSPVCEEIRCEVPRDRRLSHPYYYFYGELKLNVKRKYWCSSGFRKMADVATCTEDGWKPDPLCAEIMCGPPNIPNAQIRNPDPTRTQYEISSTVVYNCDPGFEPEQQIQITCNSPGKWSGIRPCTENKRFCAKPTLINGHIHSDPSKDETIYYTCNEGYKPFSGNWWGGVRCVSGRWSDEPRCIRLEECGSLPSVAHGQVRKTNTPDEQSAEVVCDPGFEPSHTLIRCVSGTWEKPTCELDKQNCFSPPKVKNAVITSNPQEWYSPGSHVVYICRKHFQMTGNSTVFCDNTTWDIPPTCEALCPEPNSTIENAILTENIQNNSKYSHGDTVRYECAEGYESRGEAIAKCEVNSWIYPKCIEKAQCAKPTKNLEFVTLSDEKNVFNNFDILTYTCNKPYDEIPGGTLMCENKEWNGTFQCTSKICPPPPYVEHGEFNIEKNLKKSSSWCLILAKISCAGKDRKIFYRCQDRIWEQPPKCLKPCEITPDILQEYNIEHNPYTYIYHNNKEIKLDCKSGSNVGGEMGYKYTKATCSNGELKIKDKCNKENKDISLTGVDTVRVEGVSDEDVSEV